ncbi:host cell division inhibitor Icd-like protein [Rahnella perminowiae]|uniref:host cell division inhibitor Icd-like protein n=1 Tax=Rahnella perminowiae TaxID=2816244 RepID=UPI00215C89BE|nr:host cell division inhibitor Icd-like protein [Rahnella perminowiae]MCR8999355.1 host cell division inhibitor Icd-like protein [Rahnella perminowiae]
MATTKCTYIFAAINRMQRGIRPQMLRITACNEKIARQQLISDYILLFAGRVPVMEVRNA